MNFTDIEYNFCKAQMEKWMEHPLCFQFLDPVDPSIPDYYTIITQPMDLSTMKTKLDDHVYKNSQEWLNDINLIWKNALTYNQNGSPLYVIAKFLKEKCEKKYKTIPKTEADLNELKLRKAHSKLQKVLTFPYPELSLTPRVSKEEIEKIFTVN